MYIGPNIWLQVSMFGPITSGSRPSVSDGVAYLCEILWMEIGAWILTHWLFLWFCKRVIIINLWEISKYKAVKSLQRPMFTSKDSLGIRAAQSASVSSKEISEFIVKQVPEKWPIRGQYSGHMISIDQSEASRNESCRLNQLGTLGFLMQNWLLISGVH